MWIRVVLVVGLLAIGGCKKKAKDDSPPPPQAEKATPSPEPPKADPGSAAPVEQPAGSSAAGPTTPNTAGAPAGNPPPDGKYEKVSVDGVTVPMINVMNGGTVVLVDTDGKKPRSWEEQYKKKKAPLAGQFDLHKTNTNKNDTFEDDEIDKEGIWVIDVKGNITKH